ncbi:hypothetical protein WME94_12375 [Sorangium sp. So ce429]
MARDRSLSSAPSQARAASWTTSAPKRSMIFCRIRDWTRGFAPRDTHS